MSAVIIAVPGAASLVVSAARRVYLPLVIVLAALTPPDAPVFDARAHRGGRAAAVSG